MKKTHMELGAVFQPEWDSRPIRILAFDSDQVMYDCWQSHAENWGLGSLSQKASYYRLPMSLLLSRARYLRTDEYSEDERLVHRPDLPFSFAKDAQLEWRTICSASKDEFSSILSDNNHGIDSADSLLNTPRIYLSPFGPKGSSKPGVLVEADGGISFTAEEILWHASRLQLPHLREGSLTDGVGIHRLGIQRGIPSYYVWGAVSRMGT
jgi:hypothetical protein